jgi:glycosyltransferase involved in cell wall biosynthesis
VSVTEGIQRGFAATLGAAFAPARAIVVRNGIPPGTARPGGQGSPGQPFRIVYVGTLYHSRDPRPFLRALGAAAKRLALAPSRLRVDFVGDCREFQNVAMEEIARGLGLAEFVHVRDWVPHDEAAQLVRGADLLLLLAQNQPAQVPQKLYEYLGTRVPILAFADANGETADMLRRVGGHYLVTGADDEMAEATLTEAIRAHPRPAAGLPNEGVLDEWSTPSQLLRLKSALGA